MYTGAESRDDVCTLFLAFGPGRDFESPELVVVSEELFEEVVLILGVVDGAAGVVEGATGVVDVVTGEGPTVRLFALLTLERLSR